MLCALLLIGAAVLYGKIPQRVDSFAPILVRGTAPQKVVGENVAVTVHQVISTPEIRVKSFADSTLSKSQLTKGRWIVVDASYETVHDSATVGLQLVADSRNIDRESLSLYPSGQPGVEARTAAVFDVPEPPKSLNLLAVNLPNGYRELMQGSVDSQLVIAIPLDMVQQRASVEIVDGRIAP